MNEEEKAFRIYHVPEQTENEDRPCSTYGGLGRWMSGMESDGMQKYLDEKQEEINKERGHINTFIIN